MVRRSPWHEPRVRDDGVEVGTLGLPVPGPRGTAVMFAVIVMVVSVPGALLIIFTGEHDRAVGLGLVGAGLVFVALGIYAVRERSSEVQRSASPPSASDSGR